VDDWGRLAGLLTRDALTRGLAERGRGAAVGEVMHRTPPALAPEVEFADALARLRASGLPALPVVTAAGELVGLVTMDNITDLLLLRRAAGNA
jgi:stage IV sporulation protein FB